MDTFVLSDMALGTSCLFEPIYQTTAIDSFVLPSYSETLNINGADASELIALLEGKSRV